MSSVNKAILVGRLGGDPKVIQFDSGDKLVTASVATSEKWTDKQGQKQEKTQWHNVVFIGNVAGVAEQYLKKGSLIYVEGKIETRKWQDKNGIDRYATDIKCHSLQMLGGGNGGNGNGQNGGAYNANAYNTNGQRPNDEEIPF